MSFEKSRYPDRQNFVVNVFRMCVATSVPSHRHEGRQLVLVPPEWQGGLVVSATTSRNGRI